MKPLLSGMLLPHKLNIRPRQKGTEKFGDPLLEIENQYYDMRAQIINTDEYTLEDWMNGIGGL